MPNCVGPQKLKMRAEKRTKKFEKVGREGEGKREK
jgi:hypothetical protein